MWKIEKIVSKGDYNYAIVHNHPYATKNGYVLEHRVVVENHLGRLLNFDEIVHHKDGNKKNNKIENLEVMTNREHSSHHGLEKGETYVVLKCPSCKKVFERSKNKTHLTKGNRSTFCSRSCSGRFSRSVQNFELTAEMEAAITENVLYITRKLRANCKQQDA